MANAQQRRAFCLSRNERREDVLESWGPLAGGDGPRTAQGEQLGWTRREKKGKKELTTVRELLEASSTTQTLSQTRVETQNTLRGKFWGRPTATSR